jgi:hypothetical protein
LRLSNRSAATPPSMPRAMRGTARNRLTSPSAVADPVSCQVSQLRATCSAHMDEACPSWPNQSSRKSRFSNEEKGTSSRRDHRVPADGAWAVSSAAPRSTASFPISVVPY